MTDDAEIAELRERRSSRQPDEDVRTATLTLRQAQGEGALPPVLYLMLSLSSR